LLTAIGLYGEGFAERVLQRTLYRELAERVLQRALA
jgi:hypothetical protein